jgi:hypothetical protein
MALYQNIKLFRKSQTKLEKKRLNLGSEKVKH